MLKESPRKFVNEVERVGVVNEESSDSGEDSEEGVSSS